MPLACRQLACVQTGIRQLRRTPAVVGKGEEVPIGELAAGRQHAIGDGVHAGSESVATIVNATEIMDRRRSECVDHAGEHHRGAERDPDFAGR
jgi:hypothetical protein